MVRGFGFLLPQNKLIRYGVFGVVAAELLVIALIIIMARSSGPPRPEPLPIVRTDGPHFFMRPNPPISVVRPPAVKAVESRIRLDEQVIGVEIGGKTRAYRLSAFKDDRRHLVNDLVGGVPVSIAYCNLSDCVRVYTDPKASEPLDAQIIGLLNNQMVLKLGGTLYYHASGLPVESDRPSIAPPFQSIAPKLITWREWVAKHPETDLYEGLEENEGEIVP